MDQVFRPLVAPALFPKIAFVLLVLGFAITAVFHIYGLRSPKKKLAVELGLASSASFALGVGGFFLLLSCGIYV